VNKDEARQLAKLVILQSNETLIDNIAQALLSIEPKPEPTPQPEPVVDMKPIINFVTGGTSTKRYIDGQRNANVMVDNKFRGVYRITNCENLRFFFDGNAPHKIILDIRDCKNIRFKDMFLLSDGDKAGSSYGLTMIKDSQDIRFENPRIEMKQPAGGQYEKETDIHGFSILRNCSNIIINEGYIDGCYGDGIQIHGENIRDIVVGKSKFYKCWENGIDVKDGENVKVLDCEFVGFSIPKSESSDGAAVCFHDRAREAIVNQCVFVSCRKGVRINCNGEFCVYGNYFGNCNIGIHCWDKPTIRLRDNTHEDVIAELLNDGNAKIIRE